MNRKERDGVKRQGAREPRSQGAKEKGSNALFLVSLSPCLLVCLAAGCRGPDLVAPDFRARENYVESLREELRQGDFGTLTHNRREDEPEGGRTAAYTHGEAPSKPRRLVLAPATRNFGQDARNGDTGLRVLLEAYDANDRSVQVGGSLQITAYQLTTAGQKTPLDSWDVSAAQLSEGWRADWSSAGYAWTLPWKTLPTDEQVRVEARLTLADGTRYEMGRDMTIRVAAGSRQSPVPIWEPNRPTGLAAAEIRRVSNQAPSGNGMEAAVRWEPTSLDGAIKLRRPMPLVAGE